MGQAQDKTKTTEAEPELVSLKQAARELGVTMSFLQTNLLTDGVIPFDESGSQPLVSRRDLESYKAERERREKILTEMTQEAQDLGLGYDY